MHNKHLSNRISLKNPFNRPAAFLTDRLSLASLHGSRRIFNRQLLTVSMHRSSELRGFYIRLLSSAMLLLTAALVICAAVIPLLYHGRRPLRDGTIPRPSYRQPPRQEDLLADIEYESELSREYTIPLTLRERHYTRTEAEAILQEAEEFLANNILAENTSRDEVRSAL